MKTIIAVLALCAIAPAAFAATPECHAVESQSARLACYDAAQPPKIAKPKEASRKTSREKLKTIESDASRPEYKDPFADENARTTSKLNNICRGC